MNIIAQPDSPESRQNEHDVSLEAEAQHRYLHYALSVITSRALPDVRDGLKPVQRRILYAMYHDQHLLPNAKYRKCASVVGDVLGKYHPHGDQSVYDALARMAQDFSLRYPFIDGYGNFGSQDGDPPAAYRYTECRLKPYAIKLLLELYQDTVHFRPTFDGTRNEPVVLPAQIPNLLLNGAQGIAVGMATSIPPHHAKEILTACIRLIDSPQTELKALLKLIKGPDFPTGGEILATPQELLHAYETGHGVLKLRGEYSTEKSTGRSGTKFIIIFSIPYGIDRATIMKQIGEIVFEKRLPQILSCRDESSSDLRIVIELKADTNPDEVMAYLYQYTQLQIHVQMNLTCLVPSENSDIGTPKQLSLLECLQYFLKFRFEVTTKRISFQLQALLQRIHILQGFITIYDSLDEVLSIVRQSPGKSEASKKLQVRFSLDEEQATAILETKIYQLAKIEMQTIRNELFDKQQERNHLLSLLKNETPRWALIRKELVALRTEYASERRTRLSLPTAYENVESDRFLKTENTYLILTKEGWIRRMAHIRDVSAIKVRDNDQVTDILLSSTQETILFFTNLGFVYAARMNEFPSSTGYGEPIQRFFKFQDGEHVIRVISKESLPSASASHFLVITEQGMTLRLLWRNEPKIFPKQGRKFIKLAQNDLVLTINAIKETATVTVATINGFVKTYKAAYAKLVKNMTGGIGTSIFGPSSPGKICAFSIDTRLEVQDSQGEIFTIEQKSIGKSTSAAMKKLSIQGTLRAVNPPPLIIPKRDGEK